MVQARSPAPRTHAAHVKERQGLGLFHPLDRSRRLLRLIPKPPRRERRAAILPIRRARLILIVRHALVSAAKSLGATVIYPCEVKDFHRLRDEWRRHHNPRLDWKPITLSSHRQRHHGTCRKAGMHVLERIEGDYWPTRARSRNSSNADDAPRADVKQNFDGRIVTGAILRRYRRRSTHNGTRTPIFSLRPPGIFPQLRNAKVGYMTLAIA